MNVTVLWLLTMAHADLRKSISQTTAAVRAVGVAAECATCAATETAQPTSGTKMAECIASVCSTDGQSYGEKLDRIYKRASEENPEFNTKFGSVMDKAIRENLQDQNDNDRAMLAFIDRAPKVTDPSAIRFFNIQLSTQATSLVKTRSTAEGKVVVDEKASRDVFGPLSEAQFKARVASVNRVYEILLTRSPLESSDPMVLRLIYSNEQLAKKIDGIIANFRDMKTKFENNPDFALMVKNPATWQSFDPDKQALSFKDGHFDTDALETLLANNLGMNLFMDSSTDPVYRANLTTAPIDIAAFAKERNLKQILRDRIKGREDLLKSSGGLSAWQCRYAYEGAHEVLPSNEEIERARPAISSLQQTFLGKTAGMLCSAERDGYLARASKWRPDFGRTRGDFDGEFSRIMTVALSDQTEARRGTKELLQSKDADAISLVNLATTVTDGKEIDLNDTCEKFQPNFFPDQTVMAADGFTVGPAVVGNVEKVGGITFHELGHKLWNELMRKDSKCAQDGAWFKRARACLASNHTEATPKDRQYDAQALEAGQPTRFEREDWADLISAQVDSKTNNFACFYFSKLDEAGLKGLSMRANDGDEHSSDLFRMLHMEFVKHGQISNVCREALAERGQQAHFKDCLLPPAKTADGAPMGSER